MEIPAFMLKKLYQKGSLQNGPEGVTFVVKNSISPATLIGLDLVQVGEEVIPPGSIKLSSGENVLTADQITPDSPIEIGWGDLITLTVPGKTLEPGTYQLIITINTRDVGPLTLEVSDTLA